MEEELLSMSMPNNKESREVEAVELVKLEPYITCTCHPPHA